MHAQVFLFFISLVTRYAAFTSEIAADVNAETVRTCFAALPMFSHFLTDIAAVMSDRRGVDLAHPGTPPSQPRTRVGAAGGRLL